jgi:hypothetical protein
LISQEQPNTIIIDVRNHYESVIGHFQPPPGGAELVDPKVHIQNPIISTPVKTFSTLPACLASTRIFLISFSFLVSARFLADFLPVLDEKLAGFSQVAGARLSTRKASGQKGTKHHTVTLRPSTNLMNLRDHSRNKPFVRRSCEV